MLKLRRMRTGSRCSRAKRRQPACLSRSRKLRQGGAMTLHPNIAAPASFCDRGLAVAYKRELSPSSNALSICHGTYDVSIWPVTSSMLSSNPDRSNVDDLDCRWRGARAQQPPATLDYPITATTRAVRRCPGRRPLITDCIGHFSQQADRQHITDRLSEMEFLMRSGTPTAVG
jgi:hypothetical protein